MKTTSNPIELSRWDRITLTLAPAWTLSRLRSRAAVDTLVRHYEAAQGGRRTSGWHRNLGDANATVAVAVHELRLHARDLIRNNAWARRGQRVIANNTTGTGIVPKPVDVDPTTALKAMALWKAWAGSTECESEGRHTFNGLQSLVMKTVAESGEVLIRRRYRREKDNLTIPLQLQILEPDFLDSTKNLTTSDAGGPIVQGIEFDSIGRRAAYWLFDKHPGNQLEWRGASKRYPAEDILHVFYPERPGQSRGVSWFGAAIVPLKDFDEYEDATLLRQKIAACFAVFATDLDGQGSPLGAQSTTDAMVEQIEPGMVVQLPPGKQVQFANPPTVTEDGFSTRNLRRIAAALGITYEDLTGDYERVNFSSARMGRLAHWANVEDWQWNMLIPIFCDGVWRWAMEAAALASEIRIAPRAEWTCPPMPLIEPDKEALATMRQVRNGSMTFSEMVRKQGYDPEAHFAEYSADLKRLKALNITLDSDASAVSQAGQVQVDPSAGGDASPPDPKKRGADDFDIDVDVPDALAREVMP